MKLTLSKISQVFESTCGKVVLSQVPLGQRLDICELEKKGDDRLVGIILHGLFETFQRHGWREEAPADYDYETSVLQIKRELIDSFGVVGKVRDDKKILSQWERVPKTSGEMRVWLERFHRIFRANLFPLKMWLGLSAYFPEKIGSHESIQRARSRPRRKAKAYRLHDYTAPQLSFPGRKAKDQRATLYYYALTEAGYYDPSVPLKRHQDKSPSNLKTRKEIREWFRKVSEEVLPLLQSGWSPHLPQELWPEQHQDDATRARVRVREKGESIQEVLRRICERKTEQFPGRKNEYNILLERFFFPFLEENGLADMGPVTGFSRDHALKFRNYMVSRPNLAPNTQNARLNILKAFFNELVRDQIIAQSPFTGVSIDHKGRPKQKNHPFSKADGRKILAHFEKHRPDLKFLAMCEYFGLLRPVELPRIQGYNFIWEKSILKLEGWKVGKQGKAKTIRILPEFMAILKEMKVDQLQPEQYMVRRWKFNNRATLFFPENWSPTLKEIRQIFPDWKNPDMKHLSETLRPLGIGKSIMGKQHQEELKKVLPDFDQKGYTFYGWKHTGACSYLEAGYDIEFLRRQAGHAKLDSTAHYIEEMPINRKNLFNIIPRRK